MEVLDSLSHLHRQLGLGAAEHPLISLIEREGPGSDGFDRSRSYRLELYVISMKYRVRGAFTYGRSSYDFDDGTLICLEPGQIIRPSDGGMDSRDGESSAGGWTLVFHPDLIRRSRLEGLMGSYGFFAYDSHEALHTSKGEQELLQGIVRTLRMEYRFNQDEHSRRLILNHLELLLNYCRRFYGRQFITRKNQNLDYVKRLEEFLYSYYEEGRFAREGIPTLGDCAEQFNISPNYMSDMLRKETGHGTIEFIQIFLMDRARSRLLSCGESVKEIAYGLGYDSPQYFARVFKKRTGMTPSEFRSSAGTAG